MTFIHFKTGSFAALSTAVFATAALISPISATAGESDSKTIETATEFEIISAQNKLIRSGVKAFEKGNYAKAVSFNKAAIRIRPNKRKMIVAQSNLCASWAMLEEYEQAETACLAALKLDPAYEPAQANLDLLRVKLTKTS